MILKRFRAESFRNIDSCNIEFSEGVNLLHGKNAQGKTNAIEGIYLFSRGKSFRAQDDREMISFGKEGFRISVDYESLDGKGTLEYACFGRERQRKKNGYKIKKASEMIGSFRSVLFYPDHLGLVKDGPEERRSFLNVAISQCYPSYLDEYSRFKEALENRNSLLKSASKGLYVDAGELLAWSEAMADYSSYIYTYRRNYVKILSEHVKKIGLELSSGKEEISISLKSDITDGDCDRERIKEQYEKVFSSGIEKERIVGTSLYGPQRDDLLIEINGKSARNYASQGQQRSVVLAMKLAEGEVIKEIFGEYPVFLFDDVLSELDEQRREFVINGMSQRQVIITSCESEWLTRSATNVLNVEGGVYVSTRR